MNIDLGIVQNLLRWVNTKLFLTTLVPHAKKRMVKRGQVYHCHLGIGIGSEMQKERPCIIIQNDIANIKSPNTIVIPVTHDTSNLPCMVQLTKQISSDGSIIIDGQANASNILCVSKARLGDLICTLPKKDMKKIDISIAKELAIIHYYSTIEKKLDDKIKYIDKIKAERNIAQDKLAAVNKVIEENDINVISIECIKKIINA